LGKQFATMEEQIPPSQQPMPQAPEGQITPELLAQMKARARELAVQQAIAQQAAMLVILLSCGIVTGVQWTWNIVTNILPRVEIKVR
jgi:hypothetical protein